MAGGAVVFSNFLSEVLIFVSFYQEKEKGKTLDTTILTINLECYPIKNVEEANKFILSIFLFSIIKETYTKYRK